MRSIPVFSGLFVAFFIAASFGPATASHPRHDLDEMHKNKTSPGYNMTMPAASSSAPKSHWSAPAAAKTRLNPIPLTQRGLIEVGALFRENCVACHGNAGRGNGPLADELDTPPANIHTMAQHHSDGDLHWKVAKGRGEMPGWEGIFTDEQMWMLVHYMKSLPAYHVVENNNKK